MTFENLSKKRAISDIVFAYRNIQGIDGKLLSFRDFAEKLNYLLKRIDKSISHQGIKNWEDRRNLPRPLLALQIRDLSPIDWRKDFASDLLTILNPSIYPANTEISQRALERCLTETGPLKVRYDQTYLQS